MKKFSLLLAVLIVFGLVSGCGSDNAPSETTAPADTTAVTTAPTTQPTTAPTTVPTEPPKPVVVDFKIPLPEGFELSVMQDTVQVYSSPKAPRDTSYISVEVYPRDESVLKMDTEQMADRILHPVVVHTQTPDSTQPGTQNTETTEPTDAAEAPEPFIQYLDPATVDGFDAVYTDYVQTYSNYSNHIYRYEVVTTEANYVFSFCDSTDHNDWLDAYEKAAEGIDLILDTEGIELDYSHLTQYTMRQGLTIYAENGLEHHDAKGFTDSLANRNVLILTMADDKQTNNLTNLTLADYADLVANSNKLQKFQTDMYGNLYTTFYSSDDAGLEYYNMICVKETKDQFWVCQMTCLSNDQVNYAKEFALWASSIS